MNCAALPTINYLIRVKARIKLMGDRGNICFKYSDGNNIYFYSHWDGSNLLNVLKVALARSKERWDDESYLARIVFSEMIQDSIQDLTGFGMAPYEMDKNNDTIKVDLVKQTVNNIPFEEFVK